MLWENFKKSKKKRPRFQFFLHKKKGPMKPKLKNGPQCRIHIVARHGLSPPVRYVDGKRHLRIKTIGVSIENDIDSSASSGGNDRILKAKIYSNDTAHGCYLFVVFFSSGNKKSNVH